MKAGIEKMSLLRCKSILERDGSSYSDEEILEIREFLYTLAELDYEVYLKRKLRDNKRKNDDENFKQAA